MKKQIFTLWLSLMIMGLTAQNLYVHKTDGLIIKIPINTIDSITFSYKGSSMYNIETVTELPSALAYTGVNSTVLNNSIYVIGGYPGSEPYSDVIFRYNTQSNTWSNMGNVLPYGNINHSNNVEVFNDSKLYICPSLGPYGNNGWGQHSNIMEYNINTNSISVKSSYPQNSWHISPVKHGNYIYLFGRHTGTDQRDIFRYQPSSDVLENLGPLLPYASSITVTVKLSGNDIYLFGGRTFKRSLIIFDPSTETIKYSQENFLPFDLGEGGAAWANGDKIFIINPATGIVFEYNSLDNSINESEFQIFSNPKSYYPMVSKDETSGIVYLIGGIENGSIVKTVRKLVPGK